MKRIKLVETTCRRCGKKITTGNRSIHGYPEQKKRLDRICEDCITDDEKAELLTLVPGRGSSIR